MIRLILVDKFKLPYRVRQISFCLVGKRQIESHRQVVRVGGQGGKILLDRFAEALLVRQRGSQIGMHNGRARGGLQQFPVQTNRGSVIPTLPGSDRLFEELLRICALRPE
jgi:hypothetical protein